MERTEYLDQLHRLMKLMKFQTTLPVDEIDTEFFWRCSKLFNDVLLRAFDLALITQAEFGRLLDMSNEIRDCLEVACRERFPDRTPLFFSAAFRTADKDAQGWPLKPVQLRSLLEQEIFEGLPDAAQEQSQQSSAGLSSGTGSAQSVIASFGVELRQVFPKPQVTRGSFL